MPRLPDIDSLGGRPIPQSNRRISSVRNAGVVADAVGDLGQQIAQTGNQMLEKEDRLAYAAAKSAYLKADVQTRNELADDPEYGTYESRYAEKMKAAQETAAGFIKSKPDRAMFTADIGVDFERGRGEVMRAAKGKEIVAKKAVLFEGLEGLRDTGRDALDEATRAATIQNANEMIDAAKGQGLIDAVDAFTAKEKWASDYAEEQVRLTLARGDARGANALLDRYRDVIQGETGLRLKERMLGEVKELDRSDYVDNVMGLATKVEVGSTAEAVNYNDPLRGRGTGISSGFGAKRASGPHTGVDITGKVGTPIFSMYGAGKVISVDTAGKGDAGIHVIVDHGGGIVSSYSHMNGTSMKKGDTITPDTQLGAIGMTGKTTGPHVHVVAKKDGARVDPAVVIGKARQSPMTHDLDSLLARVDADAEEQGWDSVEREKRKDEVVRRVSRDETLLNREWQEADRAASEFVIGLGDGFKSINQIPDSIRSRMDVRDLVKYKNAAESNAKGKALEANGLTAISLELMEILEPEKFASTNLGEFVGKVTKGELAGLLVKQARIASKDEVDQRPGITSTINVLATKDMGLTGQDNREKYVRVVRSMEGIINAATGGKRPATRSELDEAFKAATREVKTTIPKSFLGIDLGKTEGSKRVYDFDSVPAAAKDRIIKRATRIMGRAPSDDEVLQAYQIELAGVR